MEEEIIYRDLASAQVALDCGETVRIEIQPFEIDPQLIQIALDLQYQNRLEEVKEQLKDDQQ